MTKKHYIILGAVVLATALLQYFFGPRRVEFKEKIVEKVVVKVDESRKIGVVTDRRIERKPDGTETVTERIVERTEVEKSSETIATKEETRSKISSPAASYQVYGGVGLTGLGSQSYLFGIQKDFIGPLGLGVAATTTGSFSNSAIFGTLSFRF